MCMSKNCGGNKSSKAAAPKSGRNVYKAPKVNPFGRPSVKMSFGRKGSK